MSDLPLSSVVGAAPPRFGPARRAAVPAFEVMAVLDRVADLRSAGRDVLSLCAGEPADGAPADVVAAAAAALQAGDRMGYTPALGRADLRAAIAAHYRRWYDLHVDPASVAVTTGASGAFVALFLVAFDEGDAVAVTRPGYPAYANLLRALGIEVVEIPVGPDTGYQPTVAHLEAAASSHPRLRGLVLASPANPTGAMVGDAALAQLAGWCHEAGVRLISDEIYHGLTYPTAEPDPAGSAGSSVGLGAAGRGGSGIGLGAAGRGGSGIGLEASVGAGAVGEVGRDRPGARGATAAGRTPSAVVVSSFSKYWSMTGWRLGWAILPADLREAVDALAGNAALCPPAPAQLAALGAFTESAYRECEQRVAGLRRARAVALEGAAAVGWRSVAPANGAFYLWADLGDHMGPHAGSVDWCRALLDQEGVALVPGTDFDRVEGGRCVRLSFAAGADVVAVAFERIAAFQQRTG